MEEKKRQLMVAIYSTKEISKFCNEIILDLTRLVEFTEDERSLKIIVELEEKIEEISKGSTIITAICKTVLDGKTSIESVEKTIRKITNGEIKMINEEEET